MLIPFAIIAALILVSGMAAISFRNLVHCALSLAVTFSGVAALYLQLGAPFVGWVQILVYVGAVAILMVFAILLTRSDENKSEPIYSRKWAAGVAVAILVFAVLGYAIINSGDLLKTPPVKPDLTVREIGTDLMTQYVIPLETIALLLTAAAIGAAIIAKREFTAEKTDGPKAGGHSSETAESAH